MLTRLTALNHFTFPVGKKLHETKKAKLYALKGNRKVWIPNWIIYKELVTSKGHRLLIDNDNMYKFKIILRDSTKPLFKNI